MIIQELLLKHGLILEHHVNCEGCLFDSDAYEELKTCLQDLMNRGIVQVSHLTNDENVATMEIPYQMREIQIPVNPISPLVICVISPFSYESVKVVPWKYNATSYVQGGNTENKWLVIS